MDEALDGVFGQKNATNICKNNFFAKLNLS